MAKPKRSTAAVAMAEDDGSPEAAACARPPLPGQRVFLRHITMFQIAHAVTCARAVAACGLVVEIEAPSDDAREDFLTLYAANRSRALSSHHGVSL